ncbi:3'(2'),5'-bisphosphate nucleotidase CysQ [Parasedimentitalea huanghaiensis]|uniref:3'(2'),5'-bisphosphate nucleotidase CysQ n=1 Tax=Parasedimentitalea huanghaiensis TaxID=2682100 RepID=A0A6L6WGV5_9RHOB|nr:3'(2'),5'-bisphosphate nucleotidase CysQ [Zongyanglinia huanghaiensis]
MNYNDLIPVIRRLSIEAGNKIMEIYNSDDFDVKQKSDDSPVTAADEAADALISSGLRAAFPEMALVTEEQADSHKIKGDTFLIVDPLDGTKEFIHRRGDFTVNIALVEKGVPTRGVVYAPAKNRLFYTGPEGQTVEEVLVAGADTHPIEFNEHIAMQEPISVRKSDNDALEVVASKSHRDQATDDYINKYNVKDSKSAGSSLKFCLVATGEADIYPRVGRTMEWDTAAGHAVLTGAGGKVVRFDDHTPLVYGKDDYANPFFIAYAPDVELKEA